MAPPKMILTYFDVKALGEPVRMALAISEQDWEDRRVSREEFLAIKPDLPNGQLPVLQVGERILPQSAAQLRYVGKIAGLYPTDALEAAFADAAMDAVVDNHFRLFPALFEKDEEKKAELRKTYAETFLPTWLGNLEKALKAAGGEHFADGKLSIGDIAVAARLEWIKYGNIEGIPGNVVDEYPHLSALLDAVLAEPRIKAYREARK